MKGPEMIALELVLIAVAGFGVIWLREHLTRELGMKRAAITVRAERHKYDQLRRAENALRCGG